MFIKFSATFRLFLFLSLMYRIPAFAVPLQLGNTPWPMIHCDNSASKNAPFAGPSPGKITADYFATGGVGINQLHGKNFFYFQEMGTGIIDAFAPETSSLPLFRFDLGITYPLSGGGVIDSNNRIWWTSDHYLIRLEEDLSHPVFSEPLPVRTAWNGTTLLPDGNMLITSMGPDAAIVSTTIRNNYFPLRAAINRQELTWQGFRIFKHQVLFKSRPISDSFGNFFFVAGRYMVKWSFNMETHQMRQTLDWVFQLPADDQGSFDVSNPVALDGIICANTQPESDMPSTIYCVDRISGRRKFRTTPFSDAAGKPGHHNLATSSNRGLLFALINDETSNGGIAAIDIASGNIRWRLPQVNMSNAYALSEKSGYLYVTSRDSETTMVNFWAVNLDTGEKSLLFAAASSEELSSSLWAIGKSGDLFVPFESGFYRLTAVQ